MSAGKLKLTVLSPERKLIENATVEEVTLPGVEGQVQILPGHAPMVGILETGVFSFREPNGERGDGVISTGFFQVRDDSVTVMAETLEMKGEIDVERAKRAQKLSEEALSDANLDEEKFRKYQLKLQRSLVRQQLAAKEH